MNQLPDDKNRRVLVIDDNQSIRDGFRWILSPATGTAAAVEAGGEPVFEPSADALDHARFEVDSAYQGQLWHRHRQSVFKMEGFENIDMPVSLRSEPNRLRQVLLDLMSNAIKFTECGKVTIECSAELMGGTVAVTNGEGKGPTFWFDVRLDASASERLVEL